MKEEDLYLIATKEVERGEIDEALWSKSMALAEGDETKAKYKYIKFRVEILPKEFKKFKLHLEDVSKAENEKIKLSPGHLPREVVEYNLKKLWLEMKKKGEDPLSYRSKFDPDYYQKMNEQTIDVSENNNSAEERAEKYWRSLNF